MRVIISIALIGTGILVGCAQHNLATPSGGLAQDSKSNMYTVSSNSAPVGVGPSVLLTATDALSSEPQSEIRQSDKVTASTIEASVRDLIGNKPDVTVKANLTKVGNLPEVARASAHATDNSPVWSVEASGTGVAHFDLASNSPRAKDSAPIETPACSRVLFVYSAETGEFQSATTYK